MANFLSIQTACAALIALGLSIAVTAEGTEPVLDPIAPKPQQVDAPLPGDTPGTAEAVTLPRKAASPPKAAKRQHGKRAKAAAGRSVSRQSGPRSSKHGAVSKRHKSVKKSR